MRHELNESERGHVMVFDGPLEMLNLTKTANAERPFKTKVRIDHPGRVGNSWADAERFLHTPWPEAMTMIQRVIDGVAAIKMPTPKDRRRRPRWSDTEGEVDVDRCLHGDAEYYRRVSRQWTNAPNANPTIAILSHMDAEDVGVNDSGVYYRSAAAMALADALEAVGYGVEMWMWNRGRDVYPEPYPNQFTACRFKAAGDPIDVHALSDAMSHWFEVNAVVGSYATCPTEPVGGEGKGGTACGIHEGLGDYVHHLGISQGVTIVEVPAVYGFRGTDHSSGVASAIETAKDLLIQIRAQHGEDLAELVRVSEADVDGMERRHQRGAKKVSGSGFKAILDRILGMVEDGLAEAELEYDPD